MTVYRGGGGTRGVRRVLTRMPYCPHLNVLADLAGPWMSRSFFISFLAFFKLGTLLKNLSLGLSGKTTSVEDTAERKK